MPSEGRHSRRGFVALAGLIAASESLARRTEDAGARTLSRVRARRLRVSKRGPSKNGLVAIEEDGAYGVTSWTGSRRWTKQPPMRLRISRRGPDVRGGLHFMILPYEHGMAIEYNGVVEGWTQEFSIHNNAQNGQRQGAILWVGNEDDTGGLRITAHSGANGSWAE